MASRYASAARSAAFSARLFAADAALTWSIRVSLSMPKVYTHMGVDMMCRGVYINSCKANRDKEIHMNATAARQIRTAYRAATNALYAIPSARTAAEEA